MAQVSEHDNFRVPRWCVIAAVIALLMSLFCAIRVSAQNETGTILGTATDSSGAAIVGAKVTATNTGTNAAQSTVADAAGRYRIPDLPVGTYSVQATQAGFQKVVHPNIALTVGANLVVDFSLPVGQVTQTVNVEGEISRVETQTAAVSSLVTSQQMSQLPLNGRNFEQLLSLAPGVQTIKQAYITGGGGGGISSGFYGPSDTYSVAGSRPVGQVFLLDNQDLQGYWEKGAGSSITGNSLGVEAIREFQLLTNTYSAQFGGTGAAMNAVSKSGTNAFHGSAYEYFRNSALDARDFFDGPKIPPFRRNQFGGSLGGPIKKDKAFFFVNYEGLLSNLGVTGNQYVPDRNALGLNTGNSCPNSGGVVTSEIPYQYGCLPSGSGIAINPTVVPYLPGVLYPDVPSLTAPEQKIGAGPLKGQLSGNQLITKIGSEPTNENYILGRLDYTLGSKDSIFGRYISDTGYLLLPMPFASLPYWPARFNGGDQFYTMEEKHIVSATSINEIRFSFSRTNERSDQVFLSNPATDPLQFYLGAQYNGQPAYNPGDREDGNLIVSGGTSTLGPGATARWHLIENKWTGGDDYFWTHGAHSLKVGLSVTRIQDNIAVGREGGIFIFASLPAFLSATPVQFQGEVNPHPGFTRTRYSRATEIFPYVQDDWKIRSNLTLNLGLRYDYETNPICVAEPCNAILDPSTSTGFTQVHTVVANNPDTRNFDPRIGLAWDPFSDHKTSVRAGFGIFHEPLAARTYLNAYSQNPPSQTVVLAGPPAVGLFPQPASCTPQPGCLNPPFGTIYQIDYRSHVAPYEMQYNLTVERDIGHNTVASLGYVGAQGVHLYSQRNLNSPTLVDASGNPVPSNCTSPSCFFKGPVPNPNFLGLDSTAPTSHSTYNGLVASLSRQISRNFQGQVSYTYSRCIDDGSASSGLEQASVEALDAYNQRFDRAACIFNVTHSLRVNGLYNLPFKGNRLVSGWQIAEILSTATGYPVNVTNGLLPQVSNTGGITSDRPNFVAGCQTYAGKGQLSGPFVQWFNPSCYTPQPFGTLGNVGRNSLIGPGLLDLDFSIIKETRVNERLNAEFRAEFFNILNHTNLGQPAGAVFAGAGGAGAANSFIAGNAGLISTASTTSRQIQFAVKLIF
ncbi:MAG TPA: TonB-dependent receptor [Candidatus Dormibacteraeota bacterium]|nr:TonB-dependent receptor [Candidatus Dormibacteraeota bacterium]